jgi:hypothetical protein
VYTASWDSVRFPFADNEFIQLRGIEHGFREASAQCIASA